MILQHQEKDAFGHVRLGGIAEDLATEIQHRTGKECRHVVLGHLQRSGHPSAFDRVLGTRLGVHAMEMVHNSEFGKIAALRGNDIISASMQDALGNLKVVPKSRYDEASIFWRG